MRSKSIFGIKSITSLLYGLVMLLPFFAILGRVIYTQSNMNAKDSYSDVRVNKVVSIDSTSFDNSVLYNYKYISPSTTDTSLATFTYISLTASDLNITNTIYETLTTYTLRSNNYIWFGDGVTANKVTKSLTLDIFKSFDFIANKVSNSFSVFNITYSYLTTEKLDNAFEYSLKEFTKDNNFGNVDMFSWFTDIFLVQDNLKNSIYIGFINWYLNYALLVSSAYLLFLVLIWFTNYVRKIMDKSMYHDFGGF